MVKQISYSLAGAAVLVSVLNLISKGLGFFREIIYASYFGLKTEYEVFLIGAVIPIIINTTLLYIGQNFFIPTYNELKIKSNLEAELFFNRSFWVFLILGLIIFFTGYYFSGHLIGFFLANQSGAILKNAESVLMIFLLTTPFVAIISISSAYLQAEFKFIIPIASQLWPNVIVIISVMLLTKLSGVISIPLGILVGTIIQCINLIFLLRKKFKFNKNILNFGKLRLLSYPLAMTIIIEVSSQLFILADRIFYEKVEQGGIAALNYSMNLFLLPITIISIAFSTILFSKFSESISSENNSEFESSLLSSLNISSLIFIPIAIVFINFSNEIVSMIYQRGVFSSEDVQITSSVLQIFCIALLFYANYSILNKALYGMKSLRFLLFINVTGFVLKLVLNYFLVTDYKQNGLAFSTTFVFIFYFLTALIHILYNQRIAKKILIMKELCLSISNGVIIYFIAGVLLSPMLGSRGISKYSVILIFLAFYFLNALIVKQPSAQLLMEKGISLKHIFKAKAI